MVQIAKGFTIGIAVLLIQLFMLISSEFIFGAFAPKAEKILTVYIMLQAMAYSTLGLPKLFTSEFSRKYLMSFVIFFGITVIVAKFMEGSAVMGVMASMEPLKSAIGFGFLYIFVKVATEENIFRDLLPRYIGHLWSNVIFSLFHVSMLTFLFSPTFVQMLVGLGLLFTLGMAWSYIFKSHGIMASIGSHLGWNSVAGKLLAVS